MTSILIKDQTIGGKSTNEIKLQFEVARISRKTLIEERVKLEVDHYNKSKVRQPKGLVIPKN